MPLPADWTVNDQYRMAKLDRELVASLQTIAGAINRAKAIKLRFVASGMASRWPSATTEYVHQADDAQTRAEQDDAGKLIDYFRAKLLNDGATTALTDAQAAALLARYTV